MKKIEEMTKTERKAALVRAAHRKAAYLSRKEVKMANAKAMRAIRKAQKVVKKATKKAASEATFKKIGGRTAASIKTIKEVRNKIASIMEIVNSVKEYYCKVVSRIGDKELAEALTHYEEWAEKLRVARRELAEARKSRKEVKIFRLPGKNCLQFFAAEKNNAGNTGRKEVSDMDTIRIRRALGLSTKEVQVSSETQWASTVNAAIAAYTADPTEDNYAILDGIDHDKAVAVKAKLEATAAASQKLGYKADTKVQAFVPDHTKEDFVLQHGDGEQRAAAVDYLAEQKTARQTAAAETMAETERLCREGGLLKKLYFFGSKDGVSPVLAEAQASYIEAMRLCKPQAAEFFKLALDLASKEGNGSIAQEIIDLHAGKLEAESLEKDIRRVWSTQYWAGSSEKSAQTCGVMNLASRHPNDFRRWLDGFKGGYKTTIERDGYTMTASRAQTRDEAAELSRARVMACGAVISSKVVEETTTKDGDAVLKKGVSAVDTTKALVGFFGDVTGEFAADGIQKAASMSSMLDYKSSCGKSIRDALAEIKALRDSRKYNRFLDKYTYQEAIGVTSAKFAFDRAYQSVEANVYGLDDLDVEDGISEERWTRWFTENTNVSSQIIWDFVQVVRSEDRIAAVEAALKKEGVKNANLKKWAAIKAPAIWDMWRSQNELKAELGYEFVPGDETGLIDAILKAIKLANKMAGGSGSAWINMFAAAGKHLAFYDLFQAMESLQGSGSLFNMVEKAMTNGARATRSMVLALTEHKVPGIWRECAVGPAPVWEGMTAGFGEIAEVADDKGNTGFGVEALDGHLVYGCPRYEAERHAAADRVKSPEAIIKWYGRLVRTEAPEYEAELVLEVVQAWMDGLNKGQMPWESYPMGGLVKGDPRFNSAAIEQFGHGADVVTLEDIDKIDRILSLTGEAYGMIKHADNFIDPITGKPATEAEKKATAKEAKATIGKSEYLFDILTFEWNESTQKEVEELHNTQREAGIC